MQPSAGVGRALVLGTMLWDAPREQANNRRARLLRDASTYPTLPQHHRVETITNNDLSRALTSTSIDITERWTSADGRVRYAKTVHIVFGI